MTTEDIACMFLCFGATLAALAGHAELETAWGFIGIGSVFLIASLVRRFTVDRTCNRAPQSDLTDSE